MALLREQAVPCVLPALYVLGNHDFYGHDIDHDAVGFYQEVGVVLLRIGRTNLEIVGVRIAGMTLWTVYDIVGDVDAARSWASREMPNFLNIDIG